MEYQKIMNLLDNAPSQPTKFSAKCWIEIYDDSGETYKTNSPIKFKTSMLRSSLYVYNDTYILVSGTITITEAGANDAAKRLDERNKGVIFKHFAQFIDCISKINNTQIDNAKHIDFIMPIYNLIELSNNY